MFKRIKENQKELDKEKLNDLINLSKNTLKVLYVLLIVIGVYALIKLTKEIQILELSIIIIKVIVPLFIGFIIAWLFDPLVRWLQKKGIRRSIGTLLTYIILLSVISLVIGGLIPLLSEQLNEFIKVIPDIIEQAKIILDETIGRLKVIDGLDTEAIKKELLDKIVQIGSNITSDIPSLLVKIVKNFFSGMG